MLVAECSFNLMKKVLLLVLLIFYFIYTSIGNQSVFEKSEEEKKYFKNINFRVENGKMLNNGTQEGEKVVNSYKNKGLDVRLEFRKTNQNDIYSNIYRYPYMGIGWYTATFYDSAIGKPRGLYYFLTIPMKSDGYKKFSLSYSGAFGLSYHFNPFDSIQNPANIFIGSKLNCYVHLGLEADYKISEKWHANASLGFKHFSNGSIKKPNYGINLIPVTFGIRYKFGSEQVQLNPIPIPEFIRYNLFNVMLAFGSKNYEYNNPNYFKMTFGLNYLKAINYKYRIGIGIDMFYSAKPYLRTKPYQSGSIDAISVAVVPNWEWVVSEKIYIPLGIGIYLYHNDFNSEGSLFYERIGIRYRITNHITAGISIKAHKESADFFEWTLGCTFHNDKNRY